MHQHDYDENSAPNQARENKPTDPNAHLAIGVDGAEPPVETEGAHQAHRDKVAAGFRSIYETAHHGVKEMGIRRSKRTLLALNQKDGFDCPSCAWPDPDGDRKTAEFCENGAKAVASEATMKRLTPEIFRAHSISDFLECSDTQLEQFGRITHPMVRREGSNYYQPIAWSEAFDLIGRELRSLPSPDTAVFYTSGRASNEAAFVYGLFARQFGTNNLPDCSNMCHESSGTGLTEVIGFGKSTGRRVIPLNEADMTALGFERDAWVDITSHFEGETRRAERFRVLAYDIPRGCAAAYFPETNVLVPVRSVADKSNQPASKSVVISVAASQVNCPG